MTPSYLLDMTNAKVSATIDYRKYSPAEESVLLKDMILGISQVKEGEYLEVINGKGIRKCFRRTL